MTCERTLIHAQSTLWIAPQSLRFTLWNSGYWMSAYKERWRQHAVKFKWHSFKRLSQYLKCSPPQNGSYSHEQNSTYSVFMHVCEAWQPLLSLQIYSNNQLQSFTIHFFWISIYPLSMNSLKPDEKAFSIMPPLPADLLKPELISASRRKNLPLQPASVWKLLPISKQNSISLLCFMPWGLQTFSISR